MRRGEPEKVYMLIIYVGQFNADYTPEQAGEVSQGQEAEAQAGASALVALLLCLFAALVVSLAGSALIVAASALFAWLF